MKLIYLPWTRTLSHSDAHMKLTRNTCGLAPRLLAARVQIGLDKIPDAHDAAPQRLELHGVLVVLLADELLQVDHFKHLRRHEPPCNRRLGLRALFDGVIFPRLNMRGMKRKNLTYSRKNIENPLTYARSANA